VRSRLLAALLGLLCVVAAGCRGDATVLVDVDDDGSGEVVVTVVLDAAAAALTVDVQGTLPTDDLVATGWEVREPVRGPDGSVTLQASKPFAHPELLPTVLAEVVGVDGPLRDVRLERAVVEDGSGWSLGGVIDASRGLVAFTDPELAEALNGAPLGQSVEAWSAQVGTSVDGATGLTLVADLPGELDEHDGVAAPGTSTVSWTTTLGGPPVAFGATSYAADRGPAVFRWMVVLGVLGLLAAGAWAVSARRGARIRGDRPPTGAPPPPPPGSPPRPAQPAPPRGSVVVPRPVPRPRRPAIVLMLDGGLWSPTDLLDEALVPFARSRGVDLDRDALARRLSARLVGRIDAATFWRAVGVGGDPVAADEAFGATLVPAPHVQDFLAAASGRSTPVVVAGDAAAPWVARFRRRLDPAGLVAGWVLSEEVGARATDPALLLLAADAAGSPPGSITVVGGNLPVLDAARALGFRTVQHDPHPEPTPSDHALLTTFRQVTAER
jgi:FMN phosphatase YigB (HAD superfamily)